MVRSLLVLFLLPAALASAPRIEEQRKYALAPQSRWPQDNFRLDDYRFHRHDTYQAYDIYFSDPANELVGQGLGLRLRKVLKGQRPPEYVLQLKSEMDGAGGVRLEEESREIDDQRIEGRRLTGIIDAIAAARRALPEEERLLAAWMRRKMSSSLAPFQELRRRKLGGLELRPVVVGVSQRQRYHVYADRAAKVGPLMTLADSEKNPLLTPPIFRTNTDWVWLFEASYDNSLFYSLVAARAPYRIEEVELENKYRPRERGTQLLDRLEVLLVRELALRSETESKFLRAYKQLSKVTP